MSAKKTKKKKVKSKKELFLKFDPVMRFTPGVVEDLGENLYSDLPAVIAELIANSLDAQSKNITISIKNKKSNKGVESIEIKDNGLGMSPNEITNRFLYVGKKRRKTHPTQYKVIGKKGLGKLSAFGIAEEVEVVTRNGTEESGISMKLADIKKIKTGEYHPGIILNPRKSKKKGTVVVLRKINRKTGVDIDSLSVSVSRYFIFPNNVNVTLKVDSKRKKITDQLRFDGINSEFNWKIPRDIKDKTLKKFFEKNKITGMITTTKTPVPATKEIKGITLFSRNKLVNRPEFFVKRPNDMFYSYLTGYLNVDYIDDVEEELISTDRQSILWNKRETRELRENLVKLISGTQPDWRLKRKKEKNKILKNEIGISFEEWGKRFVVNKEFVATIGRLIDSVDNAPNVQKNIAEIIFKSFDIYTELHFRKLHPDLQMVVKEEYRKESYYHAAKEGVIAYIKAVKNKSKSSEGNEDQLMREVFGYRTAKCNNNQIEMEEVEKRLSVTNKYPKKQFEKNIEEAQQKLSEGVVQFRHSVSHQNRKEMQEIFKALECLNILSTISYLWFKLQASAKKTTGKRISRKISKKNNTRRKKTVKKTRRR